MAHEGYLVHCTSGETLLSRVRWCSSFFCKLRGLMFRRQLEPGEGLLMVEVKPSRSATAIHMLFMAFPIAAIWLDTSFRVVDKALANPWRLIYMPRQPAQYTLESHPSLLDCINIGDQLRFEQRKRSS